MIGSSTFGSFTTARLGIYAAQKALDVTGHNITNINTTGYTRQRLDQISLRSGAANRYASVYDARVGAGALVVGVSQLRDPFLDIRFRSEQASVGAMDAKLAGLEDLKTILDEVCKGADEGGILEAQFNDLVSQIQALSLQTGQEDFDTLVRSSASALTRLFNDYAGKLQEIAANQEAGFRQDLADVNAILSNISELNNAIMRSEIRGDGALELRDQRNLLLDQLSQYCKINVEYQTVNVGAGMEVEKLVVSLGGTAGGSGADKSVLIDGNFFTQLSIRQELVGGATVDSPNFNLDLAPLVNAKGETLTGSTLVQLKDNDLFGALQATREILTEAGEFTLTAVYTNPAHPDYDANAASKRGIPYYQRALDSLAHKFAEVLNKANTNYLHDAQGNYLNPMGTIVMYIDPITSTAIPLTTSTVLDPAMEAFLAISAASLGGPLFSNNGNNNDPTGITAANISISQDWATGALHIVSSFAADNSPGGTATPNSTDNSNIIHILALLDAKHEYLPSDQVPGASGTSYFRGSFQEKLTNISATLASDIRTTTTLLNNYVAAAQEIDITRDSVSGVDLNDEAASLMQFQKSYAAACRLMTTLDEALEKLINGTGIVGR